MALGTPYTIVSGSQGPSVSATLQVTVSATSVAGDAIVVAAASDSGGDTVTGITDSQGNVYVNAVQNYSQTVGIACFAALNTTPLVSGVDWIKATFSGRLGAHTLSGRGCAGVAAFSAVDQDAGGAAASSTAMSSGATANLAPVPEWAVAFSVSGNAGGAPTSWTGGFTAQNTIHPASNQYQAVADLIPTVSTVPLTAGATVAATRWALLLVTLKAGTAPVYPLAGEIRSSLPQLPPRAGRAQGSKGAPVNNASQPSGPPLYPQRRPARTRITLPPRGRTSGSPGALLGMTLVNSFDAGTNGTTITSGNSGTSGNAFGSTTGAPSGGTLAYDNTTAAHGSLSAKFATASTAGPVALKWTVNNHGNNGIGLAATLWFRLYAFFPANPTTATQIFRVFGGDTGAGGIAATASQVFVTTGGLIQFQSGTGTAILTSATKVPLGSWWRLEGFAASAGNTGQVSFSLFWPPDAPAPLESQTSAAAVANVRGPAMEADFGHANSTANIGPFWLDDAGVSTTGYLGPASLTGRASLGRPVAAAHIPPSPRQRGRAATNTPAGAPVANPMPGPVFYAPRRPARGCILAPPRGRAAGLAGAPVSNPVPPPPPQPSGPPVYPLRGPVRAPVPRVFRRGRAHRSGGARVQQPQTVFDGVPAAAAPGAFVPARPGAVSAPPPPPPPGAGTLLPLFPP